MKILEWNKQEFIFIYNKCIVKRIKQSKYMLLDLFLSFYVSCWKTKLKKYRYLSNFHEQKSNLCHYVKLNHDAMIVVSKNKERKNVENCSRQKYRKVETFFGKKKR